MKTTNLLFAALICIVGCDEGGGGGEGTDGDTDDTGTENQVDPAENWDREVAATELEIHMDTMTGRAIIAMGPSESTGASFEVAGLQIDSVENTAGPLLFETTDGALHLGLPADPGQSEVTIEYSFTEQAGFQGYMGSGSTLTWPYYCGNLFPCHSHPADGTAFYLTVIGLEEGQTAVYPAAIPFESPAYQIAWAIGDYVQVPLETTTAGTQIEMWVYSGNEQAAIDGGEGLVEAFDWMEQTLGPYPFGDVAGGVQVSWGAGAYGGMEHHPLWHMAEGAMGDPEIHVHEAAHGWFGGGVRLLCWEDLVLSEGTVSYLEARSLGQAVGPVAEQAVWDGYEAELTFMISSNDSIAWPDSCNELDVLDDGVFHRAVYIKGAYFYQAVADAVGPDVLDAVLASFFDQYAGQAATMQDMLDLIQVETGFDPTDLADGWLRSLGSPAT